MRFETKTGWLLLSVLLMACNAFAGTQNTIFDQLAGQDTKEIRLQLDLGKLIAEKNKGGYQAANLVNEDGKVTPVEVRARGKYRRRVCEIPPIKIKFSKKQLALVGLVDSLNEVKLILPCLDTEQGEDFVLREYTAYRLYEQLSPYHVRARLVRIRVEDTKTAQVYGAGWGMLIEHEEQLAARLSATVVEDYNLKSEAFEQTYMARNAVFQYMIANTDWNLQAHRNVYLLRCPGVDKLVPVPYDFDFSGLVNASYAVPNHDYGLTDVRQRYLMVDGIHTDTLQEAVQMAEQARAALENICKATQLGADNSKVMLRFLGKFYEDVKKPGALVMQR
jgi:hypothetical protein